VCALLYNPRSFLRQVPNALLARFFSGFGGFAEFVWRKLKETEVEGVLEQCQKLPEAERRQVNATFRRINSMATLRGTQVLIEVAHDRGLDIAQDMAAGKNAYERAFSCLLDHPDVFENATILDRIAVLPRWSWEKRIGLPKQQIEITAGRLTELGSRISDCYFAREGRGEKCRVEYHRRASGIDSFYTYPTDYLNEPARDGEDDDLAGQPWNGPFEVAFAYDGAAGTVDLFAEGGKEVRDELLEDFTETVLGQEKGSQPCGIQPYDLDLFKNPGFTFPTDPRDGISGLGVKAYRVHTHGHAGGTITIDADVCGPRASVYDVIRAAFPEDGKIFEQATIVEVTLCALFERPGNRHRSITFRLSGTRCDLGHDAEEQTLRRYLKTWGIEREL
jgi:hypothetical protein